MVRGKKYDACNYCDMVFPRRTRNRPVLSRIEHLNKEHSDEIKEEVTLKNYTKYLHYSDECSCH